MKITDIAERLDYKDMGYFSRLFKNKYKLPPSAYRLSDGDDYQIQDIILRLILFIVVSLFLCWKTIDKVAYSIQN